jgi:hypothetical protein
VFGVHFSVLSADHEKINRPISTNRLNSTPGLINDQRIGRLIFVEDRRKKHHLTILRCVKKLLQAFESPADVVDGVQIEPKLQYQIIHGDFMLEVGGQMQRPAAGQRLKKYFRRRFGHIHALK